MKREDFPVPNDRAVVLNHSDKGVRWLELDPSGKAMLILASLMPEMGLPRITQDTSISLFVVSNLMVLQFNKSIDFWRSTGTTSEERLL